MEQGAGRERGSGGPRGFEVGGMGSWSHGGTRVLHHLAGLWDGMNGVLHHFAGLWDGGALWDAHRRALQPR